jgi:hypothetical protein
VDELTPVTLNSHGVGKLVSVLVSVVDHSTPNSLLHSQLEMEAGVRIELTIGVLQAKNGGFRMFRRLAILALNALLDSQLRDFCKTVDFVKHQSTLSKVSITASITDVSPLILLYSRRYSIPDNLKEEDLPFTLRHLPVYHDVTDRNHEG